MVPWNLSNTFVSQNLDDVTASMGVKDEKKRIIKFDRYCHVYVEGELEDIVRNCGGVRIDHVFWNEGNWCVVFEKL